MDRNNSISSNPSSSSRSTAPGPFAYQRNLLERTGSRSGTAASLSRSSSQSSTAKTFFGTVSGGTAPPPPTGTVRRWTPTHRVGSSLDAVRGKWEARAKAEAALEGRELPPSPSREDSQLDDDPPEPLLRRGSTDHLPTYSPVKVTESQEQPTTPPHLKRHTLPASITGSPLAPDVKAALEDPSPSNATPRVRRYQPPSTPSYRTPSVPGTSRAAETTFQGRQPESPTVTPPYRPRRSNTLDSIVPTLTGSSTTSDTSSTSSNVVSRPPYTPTHSTPALQRRPASVYGASRSRSPEKPVTRPIPSTLSSRTPSLSPDKVSQSALPSSVPPSPVSSVMAPAPYRSSYMSNKRSSMYGENIVVGRHLGRHLPRIASGDADEDWEEAPEPPRRAAPVDDDDIEQTPTRPGRHERRAGALLQLDPSPSPTKPLTPRRDSASSHVNALLDYASVPSKPPTPRRDSATTPVSADDVAGVPGRLRLSRDRAPSVPSTPVPSGKLRWALWADTQRHLLHAYEYLCHVGEAQQWIEVCLSEELGFGVVEMDEGLRNGVVLAKLVRVFRGEVAVRRIYEASRLDFRHSENINIFFNFVREVGLPEGFIFELTDLYDKKNIPKVIYCIHALSHLLVRRGMAERIGNLLGRLQFSDDQLEKTQKGLTAAGVAMPNFGAVGRELAKEINEEPEVEVETEEERQDRMLMECEDSIVAVQSLARGFLVQKEHRTQLERLRLAEPHVPKLQALCRGALARRATEDERQQQVDQTPWVIALQTAARAFFVRKERKTQRGRLRLAERHVPKLQALCRGFLARQAMEDQRRVQEDQTPWIIALQSRGRALMARRAWTSHLQRIASVSAVMTKVQAQLRGVLQRRRLSKLKAAMRSSSSSVVKLQTLARARIAKRTHRETAKAFAHPLRLAGIVGLQAHARGALQRREQDILLMRLDRTEPSVVRLQAHARGVLMRRRMRTQLAKLDDVSEIVVRIQAAVRTFLARRRLLSLIRGLRQATPVLVGLQARARANLARRQHKAVAKSLSRVQVVHSVGGFQARARAALARNKTREQNKQLYFAQPDVLGFQSAARGALVRWDYYAWRDHLWRSQPQATMLQALLRGVLQRRRFRAKMSYYRANLDKVVKIQSLFRAKETREQYRQLTLGTNVNVGTIKNFVHLLDDSEADFQEEIQVERLRKKVVESIRENQALETDVNELDVKIALVVQNVKSFEELIKARKRHGADNATAHAARANLLALHGDPFAGPNTLDREAKRKLELYQQLFYLLQTKGDYLSRLFLLMAADNVPEKDRRLTERVALTLFGYGQDRREDYLLLKLFQLSIGEEISSAASIEDVMHGHPAYIGVAVHYVRSKQMAYVREALQGAIRDVINADELDLEVDPSAIHRARVELEEMRTGVQSPQPADLPFHQALKDPATRAEYIRHLQVLQLWTDAFVMAITQSTKKMPYGMRFLARETLAALQSRFPDASQDDLAACIGRLAYYRYINPAIVTPETFDIVSSTIDVPSRKNLAQISRVLTQISSGSEFGEDQPCYVPINDYVRNAIKQLGAWFMEVANVPDAESQYHAHEFLDATVQPKPIYISPNEVYAMHGLLSHHLDGLALERGDTLRSIIQELGGVPHLGDDELREARDTAVTLELTNRFAHVRDPHAEEKTLWVQAKRGVLAILRVQPAKDLVESLMKPVTEEHEATWEEIVENETITDHRQQRSRRMPSTTGAEYRLEDIRSLAFREVKAHAIYYLLELEKLGKISREDGYQGILNAIASDVRSKHRKRLQRQQEMESMSDALKHLSDRKKNYAEQIKSYHDYVEGAMKTMQKSGKGWKRFTMPFTKQYFHLRDMQKSGKLPQFGSFKYSAQDLYDKGILLSIDQYSPRQFDKIDIVISSNQVGVFSMEFFNNALGITNRMATTDLRMEDLLQAQFENKASLSLFNGMAKVNLTALLLHINKKFFI